MPVLLYSAFAAFLLMLAGLVSHVQPVYMFGLAATLLLIALSVVGACGVRVRRLSRA